jgi:uncharacterized protein with GYD domain
MPRYVALLNWTDQGVRTAKDTVRRYEEARGALEQMGVRLETTLWTMGRYDIVTVIEAPDDQTLSTALLRLAGQGNLRTETMRAFTAEEMGRIAQKLG